MQATDMLESNARVGVAVSGGVDSFTLLEVLRRRQRIVPFHFDLMALHVNPGFDPSNHAPLAKYLAETGISGHLEVTDHGPRAHSEENREKSPCFYCAMLRRVRLFELCQAYGLTHLAFGHNADDLVTTFFMNMVQNGRIDGLKARDSFFGGKLIVIRPLIAVDKATIQRAAERWKLPIWSNPCPSAGKTSRSMYAERASSLHGGDKMLRTNMINAIVKWQLSFNNTSHTPKRTEDTNG